MTTQFIREVVVDIGPAGEEGVRIEELRVAFTCDKDLDQEPNQGNVAIVNLSPATRSRVAVKGNKLLLYAGYRDAGGPVLLFAGDITRTRTRYQGTDITTEIEVADGQGTYRQSYTSLGLGTGSLASSAIREAAKDMGLTIRTLDIEDRRLGAGFSMVAPSREILQRTCTAVDAEWSIQNDELQVIRRKQTNGSEAILLTPDTGLINSPEPLDDQGGRLDDDSPAAGYSVEALLQPRAEPGGLIKVESRDVNAFLRIVSLEHRGDSRDGEFRTRMETEIVQ